MPCPECHHVCEVDAEHCAACGARLHLPLNLPEASEPPGTQPEPVFAGGAIWFDDLDGDLENAPPVHLTLRALDVAAPAPSTAEPEIVVGEPTARVDVPDGVIVSDTMAPREDTAGPPVYDEIVLPSREYEGQLLMPSESVTRRFSLPSARTSNRCCRPFSANE